MITTYQNPLMMSQDGSGYGQSTYLNSMAIAIAEDQGEACHHWKSDPIKREFAPKDEPDPYIQMYNHHKIKILFEEADEMRQTDFKVRIRCLECQRKKKETPDQFEKTEKLLTEKFLHLYGTNSQKVNQNVKRRLDF